MNPFCLKMNKEKSVKIRDLRPGRRSPLIKCIVIDVRPEQQKNKQNEQVRL